jgi:hypothetical protein
MPWLSKNKLENKNLDLKQDGTKSNVKLKVKKLDSRQDYANHTFFTFLKFGPPIANVIFVICMFVYFVNTIPPEVVKNGLVIYEVGIFLMCALALLIGSVLSYAVGIIPVVLIGGSAACYVYYMGRLPFWFPLLVVNIFLSPFFLVVEPNQKLALFAGYLICSVPTLICWYLLKDDLPKVSNEP